MSLSRMLLVIGLVLGAYECPVWALDRNSCTSLDYRSRLGPVRNQSDIGWCYANAAADLMYNHFRNTLKGHEISAIYGAFSYNLNFKDGEMTAEGGHVSRALKAMMEHGFCPRSLDDQVIQSGLPMGLKEKIEYLQGLKKAFDEGRQEYIDEQFNILKGNNSVVAKFSRNDFMKLLRQSSQKTFLNQFADALCGSQKWIPSQRIQVRNISKWPEAVLFLRDWGSAIVTGEFPENLLIKELNEQLESGNIVAISYYSKFLKVVAADKDGSHASVVVGRRWDEVRKQCTYIIRNSWGPNSNYPYPHEEGHVFVDEDVLATYLYRLTYIKP